MKILLGGAMGRMGAEMCRAAAAAGEEISFGVDRVPGKGLPFPCYGSYDTVPDFQCADILIDFSHPTALEQLLPYAVAHGLPCVLCATGYTPEQLQAIDEAAKVIPVLQSANMSLGVNLMEYLCEIAAKALKGFDTEIIEKHHHKKKDAPSGTALMLRDAVLRGKGRPMNTICGREGQVGARPEDEIAVLSVRGGTVTGEHEVGFYGEGQQLLITHRAENRALFAEGALTAAKFLLARGETPGRYSMKDVVQNAVETR